MEFGWINFFGGIIVVLILIPNVIYALKKQNNENYNEIIPKFLLIFEQIGRYACIILMWLPLLVWKFGFKSTEGFLAYFFLNGILIFAYYLIWIFYAKKASLKKGLALAIIPTAIFLLSGFLLCHPLLVIAAVLFGVSHIRITYLTHCKN